MAACDLNDLFWLRVCSRVGKRNDTLPEARCSDYRSHCVRECVWCAVLCLFWRVDGDMCVSARVCGLVCVSDVCGCE